MKLQNSNIYFNTWKTAAEIYEIYLRNSLPVPKEILESMKLETTDVQDDERYDF